MTCDPVEHRRPAVLRIQALLVHCRTTEGENETGIDEEEGHTGGRE